jgi:Protein of unknown function (DUF3223)
MFHVGSFAFVSKEDLKQRLKAYLESAPEGPIDDPGLVDLLHGMLALHPRSAEKTGGGVARFLLARNELGYGRGFMLMRTDGTKERFSYKACIDGQSVTHRSRVVEAFRFAIRGQRDAFRDAVLLPTTCAISGRAITHRGDLHIDHIVPFWHLLQTFCKMRDIDIDSLATTGSGENLAIANPSIEADFQQYHRAAATLQATHREANAAKGAAFVPVRTLARDR